MILLFLWIFEEDRPTLFWILSLFTQ